ncbi:DUF309 domain-containing protein [Salinicoccus halodurans]|uniref:DUF309 domain-containing protein n=1 Tax=Salinicoccus halodurans TaxID=407035 RepID=A0A0F7HKS3_9STAP|nr:DUF309 domain-containing protein [Salinicoccus halodurans]AKG74059.1 hypothetical protein AAT16_07315 [Salinicoccus halodurans]SFK59811.1 hypothetical protein SAMN05216235_0709 [Salinicoccus halodurans]
MKISNLLEFYNELIIKQDYFECHEIMEEAWKSKPARTKEDQEVFLILMAVGEYHYRRQNTAGAKKSYRKALKIYDENPFSLEKAGMDSSLIDVMGERIKNMSSVKFKPLHFPLTDEMLHSLHEAYLPHLPYDDFLIWCRNQKVSDEFTVNKHLLRDREHVVMEREAALKKRKHQN